MELETKYTSCWTVVGFSKWIITYINWQSRVFIIQLYIRYGFEKHSHSWNNRFIDDRNFFMPYYNWIIQPNIRNWEIALESNSNNGKKEPSILEDE